MENILAKKFRHSEPLEEAENIATEETESIETEEAGAMETLGTEETEGAESFNLFLDESDLEDSDSFSPLLKITEPNIYRLSPIEL